MEPYVSRASPSIHPDLRSLLETVGPGRLCGLFDIADPTVGAAWDRLTKRFHLHRDRGFWPGIEPSDAERLVVFGVDARGAALACTASRFFFLGPRGEVFGAGHGTGELVRFVCGSIFRTYLTQLDHGAAVRHAGPSGLRRELDLGCRPVHAVAGATGMQEYLDALRSGADADDLLEGAMLSMPLLFSHRALLATLVGPKGDDIPEDARTEAIASVLRIAKRREPAFAEVLLPKSFRPESAPSDPEVRAWAEKLHPLSAVGPFALPDPEPMRPPIRIASPWHRATWFPCRDAAEWIREHATALRGGGGDGASIADEIEARAARIAASDAAGFVRQIDQLDSHRTYPADTGTAAIAPESDPIERSDAAAGRLSDRVADAWPVLALAIWSRPPIVRARAAALLHGYQEPILARLWLHGIRSTRPPMPFGADPWTFAVRYSACASVSDQLVDSALPALRQGSGVNALLLLVRTDRDDVVTALLESYPEVALARPWDGYLKTFTMLSGADSSKAKKRSGGPRTKVEIVGDAPLTFTHAQPPPPAPQLEPPRVAGPPGHVTRALVSVGGKRVVDRFRAVARAPKVDLQVRTEAARGLLAMAAPGAAEIEEQLEKAWDRYWRI